MPSDDFEKDISLGVSNNNKEKIRTANIISNDNKNSKPVDIDEETPIIPNWTTQNKLLSKLSQNFKEVTFSESKFLFSIPVLDTGYVHPGSQSSNPFYPFNNQLNYAQLAYYFAELETTQHNIDKFLSNLLMKPIT